MRRIKKYREYFILFFFVFAAIIAYKLVDRIDVLAGGISTLVSVASPFIVGLLLAFILNIPVSKVEKLIQKIKVQWIAKHSKGISVAAVYLLTIGVIVLLLVFVLPALAASLVDLIYKLPDYANNAVEWVRNTVPPELINVDSLLASITEMFTMEKILSFIDVSQLTTYAHGVFKVGSTLFDFFVAAIVSVYMLLSKESLLRMLVRILYVFVPRRGADTIVKYSILIADIFYKYIYSQCLDAFIVGIACAIAFSIVGIPYAVLMGFIVGVSNLIPYFGAIVSGVCTVLLTLLSGEPIKALIIAVLIVVIQQVDANVLQPRVVSNSVGIKPLYVLFAITVGGGLFGVAGMLIGVPVVAVIKVIIEDLIEYTEKRKRAVSTEIE